LEEKERNGGYTKKTEMDWTGRHQAKGLIDNAEINNKIRSVLIACLWCLLDVGLSVVEKSFISNPTQWAFPEVGGRSCLRNIVFIFCIFINWTMEKVQQWNDAKCQLLCCSNARRCDLSVTLRGKWATYIMNILYLMCFVEK